MVIASQCEFLANNLSTDKARASENVHGVRPDKTGRIIE